MDLHQLAATLKAQILTKGRPGARQPDRVVASDRVSELLQLAGGDTLLLSAIPAAQLLRIAELMDAPAICVIGDSPAGERLIATARGRGIALLFRNGSVAEHLEQTGDPAPPDGKARNGGSV